MADEMSNKMVISILLITMVVSLGGTFMVLTKMSAIQPGRVVFTGMATYDDYGYADIQIASTLAIDVVAGNTTIDFGTCTFNSSGSGTAEISSAMSEADINATPNINCSSSSGIPGALVVENTGNMDCNLTFSSQHNATGILTAALSVFRFRASDNVANPGCDGGSLTTSWTDIASTSADYIVCTNLTRGSAGVQRVDVWLNFTVPKAASTPVGYSDTDLTFTGDSENEAAS